MRRVLLATVTLAVVACDVRSRQLAPIRLEPMAAFGDVSGDGAIATDPRISPRHRGGFRIVIPGAGGVATPPLVYADDGHFLGTLHGGRTATEQFQSPLFARIGPGDSIWIFDGAPRVLVFGPDRGFVRAAALPASPWDALVLNDSRMLIAPADADRPLPLLLLTPNGDRIREFGAVDSTSSMPHSPRWLIGGNDGSFWSMPMQYRWRLEHWDSSGVLIRVVERQPNWFKPYARQSTPDRNHAPQPAIRGAWVDSLGRLWVLGMVADPAWATGLGSHRTGEAVIAEPDKVYDTILEAIDLATGEVVGLTRLDPAYTAALEPGVILHVREIAGGWKRVDLMRVLFDPSRSKAQ